MLALLAGLIASAGASGSALAAGQDASFRDRLPQDEVIYFLLPDRFANGDTANDRGGLVGDRLTTGYDPTDRGFFHGGDLKGLTGRLDYIQGLGATAVWLAPVFVNKVVQGPPGHESAGYHGYWITDFTRVDPHLGANEDFAALVNAAHSRGMKVYLDIVINHTADVIRYRECPANDCVYRWAGDYPYQRRGGTDGEPINEGFTGAAGSDFARLMRPDYAYTPYVPTGEETVKTPVWLNDPLLYHNRGNSAWYGQSALDGDFSGLDDLFTENPRVVEGFIQVYGDWIERYGIDGYRIDTARHVNPEFWQAFVPAMQAKAKARGIPNFAIFGEVYGTEPAELARHTVVDRLPAVLDFAFQKALQDMVAGTAGPDRMATVYAADPIYAGGDATAMTLPTFTGNHDMGRIGRFLLNARPGIGDAELLARSTLAHALMMFGRGAPVIYYGDEQGFTGDGDDKASRQDMFETRTPDYADDRRVGQASGPYDVDAALYRRIAEMARLRAADVRLRRGRQVVRQADQKPGVFAVSRLDDRGGETLIVYNTSDQPISARIPVETGSTRWRTVRGQCPATASAPASAQVTVPPLD
ncbi:alpha-amylase family glycosyl hydrolase [soil metagenome]